MLKTSRRVAGSARGSDWLLSDARRKFTLRWWLASLMGATAVVGLTGCDGGPGFSTSIEVSNHCGDDIAVALSGSVKSSRPSNSVRSGLLRPDETVSYGVSATQEPGGDVGNVWVVVAVAEDWGDPVQFSVDDLLESKKSNGRVYKEFPIEGDWCPAG